MALALLPALCGAAQAGDEQIKTILTQVGVWDSNPQMLARGAENIYGSTTSPQVTYDNKTQTSKVSLSALLNQNLFNRSAYNSTDLFGRAGFAVNNERWEARLNGNVDYDTTRTSELTTYGLDIGSVRHFAYKIAPGVSFTPTKRDTLALDGSFYKAVYDSDRYANYTTATLSPSYTRSLSQLTSAMIGMDAQRFQSERDPKRRVDSLSPTLGFATSLTPEFSLRANAGGQVSQERGSTIQDTDWKWHYIYSADLTYKDEQDQATFKATRAREPFSNGTDALLTTISLDNRHKLNPKLAWTVGGSFQSASYETETRGSLDNKIIGKTGLSYAITDSLDINGNYQYRQDKLTGSAGTAEQNLGRLGLTYRPNWDRLLP